MSIIQLVKHVLEKTDLAADDFLLTCRQCPPLLSKRLARRSGASPLRLHIMSLTIIGSLARLYYARFSYEDGRGRGFDFHALRHQFSSNLASAGVHPKVAQQLARHCSISLTLDRYTDLQSSDVANALQELPELPTTRETHANDEIWESAGQMARMWLHLLMSFTGRSWHTLAGSCRSSSHL